MRRVRLLVWKLYYRTPLGVRITEDIERSVATACNVSWFDYCVLKSFHAELWQRYALKRHRAEEIGYFPTQPKQLATWRNKGAKEKAAAKKDRRRMLRWASREMEKSSHYKQNWRKGAVLIRVLGAFMKDRTGS
jgi:hypothetical protein